MHIVIEYEFECRLKITTGSFFYQPLKPCRVLYGQILKLIYIKHQISLRITKRCVLNSSPFNANNVNK